MPLINVTEETTLSWALGSPSKFRTAQRLFHESFLVKFLKHFENTAVKCLLIDIDQLVYGVENVPCTITLNSVLEALVLKMLEFFRICN